MALASALKDRARVVQKEAAGPRVAGRTIMEPVEKTWFKARLFLPLGEEQSDNPGAHNRKQIRNPQLLLGKKDVEGQLIVLKPENRVEVDSPQQGGVAIWRVTGAPQPLRKRRTVIGYLVNLARTNEPTRVDEGDTP